jgi:hypothetical protein
MRTADGREVDLKYYCGSKCGPQVEETTTRYSPIAIVRFDTLGRIPREYVEELVQIARRNQPKALVSGRASYGLGDYQTPGGCTLPNPVNAQRVSPVSKGTWQRPVLRRFVLPLLPVIDWATGVRISLLEDEGCAHALLESPLSLV